MNMVLKQIPCNTVDEILKSVFSKHESFDGPLDGILNHPFSVEEFLASQDKEDDLTDILYEKTNEGLVIFPLEGLNNSSKPYIGRIGDQTSRYHQENIKEHLLSVLARIHEQGGSDLKLELAALLHDSMKKYTAGTNKLGEICFYGHEKLSAYYAAKVFEQLGYEKEEARPYVAMIHGHMLPKTAWRHPECGEKNYADYVKQFGRKQADMITLFSRCDTGIQAGHTAFRYIDHGHETVIEKEKAVNEGKKIAHGLTDCSAGASSSRFPERVGIT